MEKTVELTTVGELLDFLAGLPKDMEIGVESVGRTGFVNGPITLTKYEWDVDGNKSYDVYINIPAESGYY